MSPIGIVRAFQRPMAVVESALSAFYQKIKVGHIEAGLRTHNIYSPWPEEMNRQITGRIANYHFAPTKLSKDNLISESINDKNIIITGNTSVNFCLHLFLCLSISISLRCLSTYGLPPLVR